MKWTIFQLNSWRKCLYIFITYLVIERKYARGQEKVVVAGALDTWFSSAKLILFPSFACFILLFSYLSPSHIRRFGIGERESFFFNFMARCVDRVLDRSHQDLWTLWTFVCLHSRKERKDNEMKRFLWIREWLSAESNMFVYGLTSQCGEKWNIG